MRAHTYLQAFIARQQQCDASIVSVGIRVAISWGVPAQSGGRWQQILFIFTNTCQKKGCSKDRQGLLAPGYPGIEEVHCSEV